MLRRRKAPDDPLGHVDPAAASPRFEPAVSEALDARRRYRELLDGLRPGPVRDRLATTGERLEAGVLAVWDTARRASEIERTLAALDPERVAAEYKRAKRAGDDPELETGAVGARDAAARSMTLSSSPRSSHTPRHWGQKSISTPSRDEIERGTSQTGHFMESDPSQGRRETPGSIKPATST